MERDVFVHEVGLRDGLQSIAAIMPTADKMHWIAAEAAAGVPIIQVGSFVPPARMPQLADTAELVAFAKQFDGLQVTALVPNLKGAELAVAAEVGTISYVLSVSELHNQANVRRSVEESLVDFAKIVALRDTQDPSRQIRVSGGLATAFGCSLAGPTAIRDVMRAAERMARDGADRIGIADTVGHASPSHVKALFSELCGTIGRHITIGAHFHDTRGLGLANVFAALEAGVREFDGALGGLGGCPYAPGATGNIVTEDLVFLLEAEGLRTGVDLDQLVGLRRWLDPKLAPEPTHGTFVKAGFPKGFRPGNWQQT